MKQLLTLFLLMYMSLSAMASNTSVKNADGVEIWYDFDSSAKTASVTYKGDSAEPYSNDYTGEVVIPSTVTYEGVEYSVTSIGNRAFYYCRGLISVTIPESVTSIGDYAFDYCSALTSITLPEGVTSIGDCAFYLCYSLTSITLPEGLTSIGQSAFNYCSALTSITLPESLTSIGKNAFMYCYSLTSITFPEGVTSIGDYTFYECDALTSITLPEGLTSIGNRVFEECDALTSITLPEGVTKIGYYAFRSCFALTSITLPESLTSIGNEAFYNCYRLYEVYNKSDLTITAGSTDNGYVAYYAKNVYTEGESKLKTVGDYIFYVDGEDIELIAYTGSETSITLLSDYEGKNYDIGDYAFYNCDALTSITIPEGVTSIGKNAFRNCYALRSITLPEGLTSIGKNAFSYCSSLTSITLPEGVTSIGDEAFRSCTALTSITLPESLTSIGDYAFSSCKVLTSITIPEGVTSIGNYAFSSCKVLTSITIPEGVTSIGNYAFEDCSALTSITSKNATPPTIVDGYTFQDVNKSIPVYVPKSSVDAYKSAVYWKDFTNIVGVYFVDVTAENGTVEGAGAYEENAEVKLTVTPAEGYKFVKWSDGVTDNPRTVVVVSDTTFTADVQKCWTVYATAENGDISGIGVYFEGDEATLTVTPNEGYKFVQWSDGVTDNPRTVVVVSDTTFTAVFEIKEYTLTTEAENGTVEGAGTYKHGAEAILTATPNEGYKFVQWSDGVTDNPRTVVVVSDTTLTADIQKCWTVNVTAENGYILGVGVYLEGDEVTITATPNEGCKFVKWSDGVTDNPRTVVVTSDMTFTAVFELKEYTLTTEAENGTVEGAGTYKHGDKATLTATPIVGYIFAKWSDGVTDNPRIVVVVSDTTFTAEFEIDNTPISDIQTSDVNVRLIGSSIVVDGADDYTVYSINGQNLGKVERVERGIYIVVVNGKSYKVIAK